ncbi:MAG: OmpA family protein [Bryobacteraceae bacterium]
MVQNLSRSTAMLGVAFLAFVGTGCATKKHVRGVIAPVEARVGANEKTTAAQGAHIGEIDNNVSRIDEKATEADRRAGKAGEAAQQAQLRADEARARADQAGARADQAHGLADSTRTRLGEMAENIDNYQLVTTESIYFGVNKHALTKEATQQLDDAIGKIKSNKNFILEVQGIQTTAEPVNLALSQKRADAVVRYLTVNHSMPLRKINVLGIGEDDKNADNKTKEGRKQARRVEIKVFALDLNSPKKTEAAATN